MKQNDHDEITTYAQMGVAALIPGMQRMIELMQHELDMMRARLTGMQEPRKKMGRPRKVVTAVVTGEKLPSGWPADPEERKLEMARRMAARGTKRKKRTKAVVQSMVNKDHPDHEKFRKKMKRIAKRRWANMTPRERKVKLAAMQAGRRPRAEGPVTLAVAS